LTSTSVPTGPNSGVNVTTGSPAAIAGAGRLVPSRARINIVAINLINLIRFKLLPPEVFNLI
jgi:hypothetical protein